jgi:hypothetical protein
VSVDVVDWPATVMVNSSPRPCELACVVHVRATALERVVSMVHVYFVGAPTGPYQTCRHVENMRVSNQAGGSEAVANLDERREVGDEQVGAFQRDGKRKRVGGGQAGRLTKNIDRKWIKNIIATAAADLRASS